MPTSSTSASAPSVAALPRSVGPVGGESSELHGLVAGPGDAGAVLRSVRTALFPSPLQTHEPFEKPRGLHRPELVSRDDPAIDTGMQYLAREARGHAALLSAIKRSGQHRAEVERVLRAWKLPEELVALVFLESGFDPTLLATDGGAGLWSLPHNVAEAYGLTTIEKYDERRAIALSTEAAGHYLSDLRERFGSWELAILAFGSGYKSTLDSLSKRATTDFWDIEAELPADDAQYVTRALAIMTLLANPERFGLDVVRPDDPVAASDLEVPGGTPFSIVARAAGTSLDRLRELNPEYLGTTVPNTSFTMVMHLPSASLARAKELLVPLLYAPGTGLGGHAESTFDWGHSGQRAADGGLDAGQSADASKAAPQSAGRDVGKRVFYRVQDGDTLDSIARRFGIARETIASDNALDPGGGLHAGQLLTLRQAVSVSEPTKGR